MYNPSTLVLQRPTFTAWGLLVTMFITSATVAPSFAEAQDGWDATKLQTVSSKHAIPPSKHIRGVRSTVPGDQTIGDHYLVSGNNFDGNPANFNKIVTWDGAAWSAEDVPAGTLVYDLADTLTAGVPDAIYVRSSSANPAGRLPFLGSTWLILGTAADEPDYRPLGTSIVYSDDDLFQWLTYIDVMNTPITITLPGVLTINKTVKIKNRASNSNEVTVQVSGGGNINDVPTLTLRPGQAAEIHSSSGNTNWATF